MTNVWTNRLETIRVILFDYPAFFELGRFPDLNELADIVVEKNIQIIVSSSFKYYHICVLHAKSDADKLLVENTERFLARLQQTGLLQVEDAMSLFTVLPSYIKDKNACLITGKNAPILHQLRSAKLAGEASLLICSESNIKIISHVSEYVNSIIKTKVNSVSSSSDYLDVSTYCNVGDSVFTEEGGEVVLTEKINTGAEGLVFRTKDADIVAKIYHRGVMTPLRWMKLTRMTRMGLRAKGICWPTNLLFNSKKEPVGFIMPTAQGYMLSTVFDGPDAISVRFPEWNRSSVTQAACQVLERIVYLHLYGILIGDLQLKNIMIKSPTEIYLIDMDSVQLEDLPCPVGTEDFTPPELWDHSFASFLREPSHEDYSCGILAFSMLFCGQHPYNQRDGHETLREEIASRSFPYTMKSKDDSGIPLGGYDKIWEVLSPDVQNMFCRAFSDGKRFETIAWYASLLSYRDRLMSKEFEDPEYYSIFPYAEPEIILPDEIKPTYKKSIKEAIIHAPEVPLSNNEKTIVTPERVMYNGKRIGVAFVNQDKLMQIENSENIKNIQKKMQDEAGSAAVQTSERTETGADPKNVSSNAGTTRIHKAEKSKARFSQRTRILLSVLIILLAAILILLYKYTT